MLQMRRNYMEEMKLEWATIEKENAGCTPGFYEWFCTNKLDSIIAGML